MYEHNMVDWFVKGGFFGKMSTKDVHFQMSPIDFKDILYAVKKAYIDMTPRTIKGLGDKRKRDKEFSSNIESVLTYLAEEFVKYFNDRIKTFEEFEKWHLETCDTFLKKFNALLSSKGLTEIEYGKAQKIVNMTFKYIYCFSDKTDEGYFKNCHMPLDTFTLDWFYKEVASEHKKDRKSWSNLDVGSEEKVNTYLWIQSKIRMHLKEQKTYPQNPLEAEFYIWPKYRK